MDTLVNDLLVLMYNRDLCSKVIIHTVGDTYIYVLVNGNGYSWAPSISQVRSAKGDVNDIATVVDMLEYVLAA